MKKHNNKGFSLIELIIAIAILVILTGLLAPQFMRYIEKSRVAKDMQTLDTVYEAVQAGLTNEDAYEEFATAYGSSDGFNGTLNDLYTNNSKLAAELKATIGTISDKEPKLVSRSAGGGKVYVKIAYGTGDAFDISVYCGTKAGEVAAATGNNTTTGLGIVGNQAIETKASEDK
jgi:prepilin-type N-terminal cleavage/methylation domain-containing protein